VNLPRHSFIPSSTSLSFRIQELQRDLLERFHCANKDIKERGKESGTGMATRRQDAENKQRNERTGSENREQKPDVFAAMCLAHVIQMENTMSKGITC